MAVSVVQIRNPPPCGLLLGACCAAPECAQPERLLRAELDLADHRLVGRLPEVHLAVVEHLEADVLRRRPERESRTGLGRLLGVERGGSLEQRVDHPQEGAVAVTALLARQRCTATLGRPPHLRVRLVRATGHEKIHGTLLHRRLPFASTSQALPLILEAPTWERPLSLRPTQTRGLASSNLSKSVAILNIDKKF